MFPTDGLSRFHDWDACQERWQSFEVVGPAVTIYPPAIRQGIERNGFETFMQIMESVGHIELAQERRGTLVA